MKNMVSGGLKGIGGVIVFWLSYINNTFTPLIWILLALVAMDLFLNAHKEGQQFSKIGSMAVTLGAPGYIAANLANPNLGKYVVAIMCIVYLKIVVPVVVDKLASVKFSKDPVQNKADQATIQALLERISAMEEAKAQRLMDGIAGTPKEAPKGMIDGLTVAGTIPQPPQQGQQGGQ
jgi:hypothetical protein